VYIGQCVSYWTSTSRQVYDRSSKGDFRERFSTRLHTCAPASHPVLEGVTSPQRGEVRWEVVPQTAVRGGGHRPRVPPSNLPPLGGGKESVHTAMDHNEGGSFEEIA